MTSSSHDIITHMTLRIHTTHHIASHCITLHQIAHTHTHTHIIYTLFIYHISQQYNLAALYSPPALCARRHHTAAVLLLFPPLFEQHPPHSPHAHYLIARTYTHRPCRHIHLPLRRKGHIIEEAKATYKDF
jgi:hypothetical protein